MAARITARVEIDEAALERESGRDLRAFHRSLTRRIANQSRADVPVRTGNLGRTIGELPQVYVPFHVSGGVEATADYAAPVHEGSHGREVFRKSVWHPGTRARPFMRNAARRVVAEDPRIS